MSEGCMPSFNCLRDALETRSIESPPFVAQGTGVRLHPTKDVHLPAKVGLVGALQDGHDLRLGCPVENSHAGYRGCVREHLMRSESRDYAHGAFASQELPQANRGLARQELVRGDEREPSTWPQQGNRVFHE